MTFPREYERHFFRDLDKDFFFIWLVSFMVFSGLTYYMSGKPLKPISAEDIKRYNEVIYRVKATPPRTVEKAVETGAAEAVVEEEPEKVEEVVEEKPVTEVAKKEAREEKRAARRDKQELRRQKIREAAKRMKILAGPTSRGGRRAAGGGAAAREALGLTAGGMEGYDVKKMAGMVGEAGKAETVKKMRGGGAISEEVGEIDIDELRALASEDLDLMLKEASVTLNRQAITAKGRGSKSAKRSQTIITDMVVKNQNQVTYCYVIMKRRDSSLKGYVVTEFTINPAGEVIRVRFRQSDWGGNKLGEEVERCMKNIIMTWRFDPIGENEGNVTGVASYGFE